MNVIAHAERPKTKNLRFNPSFRDWTMNESVHALTKLREGKGIVAINAYATLRYRTESVTKSLVK